MRHTRNCRECNKEFTTDKPSQYICSPECKKVRSIRVQVEWRENNTRRYKELQVKHSYGVTLEHYEECMSSSHCCEICGKEATLCYDHDHLTDTFRGVLCKSCNKALGSFGDDLQGINKVVTYLKRSNR